MKILIIRRDNIGDLILTTPLISMLAKDHQVDMLVNSYNKLVLQENPCVNKIHHYTKLHHEGSYLTKILVFLRRIKTTLDVWKEGYDVAIVAGNWNKRQLHWARLSRAKRVIAVGDDAPDIVTDKLPYMNALHMVEQLAQLARPLGCETLPGKLEIFMTEAEIEQAAKTIINPRQMPIYGLQISSRKEKQRWPIENFVELAHKLSRREVCKIVLFWSPGSSDNLTHPGDDEKSKIIMSRCEDINIVPYSTKNIRELMAGMILCDQIITSDGGALHMAAGVGKPVVALFGNSESSVWGPWKVPSRVLESSSRDVTTLSIDEVYRNFIELRNDVVNKPYVGE